MLLVQCLATAALSQNRLLHEWFHSTNYVYGTEIQTRKGFDGIDKITVQQFFVVVSYNSMALILIRTFSFCKIGPLNYANPANADF